MAFHALYRHDGNDRQRGDPQPQQHNEFFSSQNRALPNPFNEIRLHTTVLYAIFVKYPTNSSDIWWLFVICLPETLIRLQFEFGSFVQPLISTLNEEYMYEI